MSKALRSIDYRGGADCQLLVLNQLLLPLQSVYDNVQSVDEAFDTIKSMKVHWLHPLYPTAHLVTGERCTGDCYCCFSQCCNRLATHGLGRPADSV